MALSIDIPTTGEFRMGRGRRTSWIAAAALVSGFLAWALFQARGGSESWAFSVLLVAALGTLIYAVRRRSEGTLVVGESEISIHTRRVNRVVPWKAIRQARVGPAAPPSPLGERDRRESQELGRGTAAAGMAMTVGTTFLADMADDNWGIRLIVQGEPDVTIAGTELYDYGKAHQVLLRALAEHGIPVRH